jgi:hypothetical protein
MAYRTAVPLTAEWLIKTYLFGISLTDDDNNYFPAEIFQMAINSALAWAETEFGIHINKTVRTSRVDASGGTLLDYPPIVLPDAKIQSVSNVKWKLGNSTQVLEWPIDWFVVRGNQLQLVPAATGPSQEMTASYPLFALYAAKMGHSSIPGVWEVTYTAGFETDGTITDFTSGAISSNASVYTPSVYVWNPLTITLSHPATVARTFQVYGWRQEDGKPFDGVGHGGIQQEPETVTIPIGGTVGVSETSWSQVSRITWTGWSTTGHTVTFSGQKNDPSVIDIDQDLLHLIGMAASVHILNTAGDLIIGAGIANKSVSIDAISAAIGTTSSPTNAGYGARIIQLQREIKAKIPILFRKYNGIQVSAW